MKKSRRNTAIDLLRIIAIILVIACHIALPPITEIGQIDKGRLALSCLVGDGVSIFLIISGFFIFREGNYLNKLKKVLKTIVIPSLVLILFTDIFYDFITNKSSIIDCFSNYNGIKENIRLSLIGILGFNSSSIPGAPHLWYVFTYITCYLWVPLISLIFIKNNEESQLAKRIVILLSVISLVITSLSQLFGEPFSYINSITIVMPALLLIIIGKIIYDNIEKIKNNKKIRYYGLTTYFFVSVIKIILQYFLYSKNIANPYFLYWYSLPAIIESIGLILFILSFDFKSSKLINNIGVNAFNIYLIHWMIKEKMFYNGFFEFIKNSLNVNSFSFISECLYTLIITSIVFGLSLILSETIEFCKYILRKCFHGKN